MLRTPPKKKRPEQSNIVTRSAMSKSKEELMEEIARLKAEAQEKVKEKAELVKLRAEIKKANDEKRELHRLQLEARQHEKDREELEKLRTEKCAIEEEREELLRLRAEVEQREREEERLGLLRARAEAEQRDAIEQAGADALLRDQGRDQRQNLNNRGNRVSERAGAGRNDIVFDALTEERRRVGELRAEIDRLQRENAARGNPRDALQQQDIVADGMMQGLMGRMHTLSIDLKVPRYSDDENEHAVEFLESMEEYYELKRIPEIYKLAIMETALRGRSESWMKARRGTFRSYAEFKRAFLDEFYSIQIQVRIKSKWVNRRYQYKDGSMQNYFLRHVKEARHFEPLLRDFEVHFTVLSQLPLRAREHLTNIDYTDANKIAQALANLDAINEERDRETKRYQNKTTQQAGVKNLQTQYEYDRGYYDAAQGADQFSRPPPKLDNTNWRQRSTTAHRRVISRTGTARINRRQITRKIGTHITTANTRREQVRNRILETITVL